MVFQARRTKQIQILLQGKTAIQADIDAIAESIDFLKFNHHYAKVSKIIFFSSYFLFAKLILVIIILENEIQRFSFYLLQ